MLWGALKIAILAILVYLLVDQLLKMGVRLHYKKHHPGQCRQVKGLDYGSEDVQVTKDGLAFITSGMSCGAMTPTYTEFMKANEIRGRIFSFHFKNPDSGAQELKIKPSKDFNPETFRPHGLSLLEDNIKGEHLLYVINHPHPAADRVEKFRYLPDTNELAHVKFFSSDKFTVTNDMAMISEDKFYISNSMYFRNPALAILETLLCPIPLCSLILYNGTDFTYALPRLFSPNGVTLSKDGRYLYVNLMLSSEMQVYERKGDNSLTLVQTVPLYTAADNSHLSQSGDTLYLGAHPIVYKALEHLDNPNIQAPSSILRIPLREGKVVPEDITELFYDHGDLISASSVAAVYDNKLLIGSVIDKLVLCDANIEL